MSADRAYLTSLNTVLMLTAVVNKLELRLLNISAEKTLKYTQGAAQTSAIASQMTARLNAVDKKYANAGNDYESNMQYLAERESIENEYTPQIQQVRDAMSRAEQQLDTQQTTVETQKEVRTKELETWKELVNKKAEQSYFE